jgi:hypothetical protein
MTSHACRTSNFRNCLLRRSEVRRLHGGRDLLEAAIPAIHCCTLAYWSVRTVIGLGAGFGVVFAGAHVGILRSELSFYALLAPIRMCEWLLLLSLFFRPNWEWLKCLKLAVFGTLWSYVLDIPAALAVFTLPGGAWIC